MSRRSEAAGAAGGASAAPPNVRIGPGSRVQGEQTFKRFRSTRDPALVVGADSLIDGTHLAIGESGAVVVGDHCYLSNAIILCELEIAIGSYVMVSWNATIADSDFHPLEPALRVLDAIACSPLAGGRRRPAVQARRVVVEDDVWIGPNATVLKGVRIGRGSFVEPGSVLTQDVPPGSRVMGNPARVVERLVL